MSVSEHRINRVVFEIAAPDQDALAGLDALIRNRFDAVIAPALAAALDRVEPTGRLRYFERIEIDAGALNGAAADAETLARRIAEQLAAALPAADAAHAGSTGPARDEADELLGFLDSGELPWREPGKALAALGAALLASDAPALAQLAARLRPALLRRSACVRLARQLPAGFVRRLLLALLPADLAAPLAAVYGRDAAATQPAAAPLPAAPALACARMLQRLAGVGAPPEPGEVVALLAALAGGHSAFAAEPATPIGPPTEAEPAPPAAAPANTEPAARPARALFAAGAVLLHPFLAPFFQRLGLLDGAGGFLDSAAQQRAVLLGHFLASGASDIPEPETVLFKLLCGVSFAEPLPRALALTDSERSEADNLLRSTIAHWSRLGHTTPDGLREAFLLRPGRLEQRGDNWRLRVEPRGVDVLLDQLPWTLSRVRTPFMRGLLAVEWR